MKTVTELRTLTSAAIEAVDTADEAVKRAKTTNVPADELARLEDDLSDALRAAEARSRELERAEASERARARHVPMAAGGYRVVNEPDLYEREGRNFMQDLYNAQIKGDLSARDRIESHHRYELEQRAVTTSTVGGIIPPAYLIDLYAKASRNGRVFADQCNQQDLPDVGMSIVVPRLTQGTAAGIQATENATVSTQDPTETDLSVPVRTIAGYSPVSRQTLERAAYSDRILFEDLTARYWATLDTQALNGTGSSGQMLGALQTSGIATSTSSTATVAGIWPKIADLIQQINTNVGGLGYVADKIVMHPRRWGFFEAALDSNNRPLFGLDGVGNFNAVGAGNASGYGGPVGRMHGLPVYTDANIPVTLGASTSEDRIIVMASSIVHLWERPSDPVTLAFEQTSATTLTVNLICFGYAAFTAGRFPLGLGVVSGAALVPPTW